MQSEALATKEYTGTSKKEVDGDRRQAIVGSECQRVKKEEKTSGAL